MADLDEIYETHNHDYELSKAIINIVYEFVVSRKLIVYGGLSIDLALRLTGSHIYRDGQLMDIDVYSPDSVKDAYDLVDLLRMKGYKKVAAVRAIHLQTMKVRCDFIWAADISYITPALFASLPTLDYNGLKIIHPHYQMMDMHLSLSFPFSNPPSENCFNRWSKDINRYNLIIENYPISLPTSASIDNIMKNKISIKYTRDVLFAFHGYAAFNILLYFYEKIVSQKEVSIEITDTHMTFFIPDTIDPSDELFFASPFQLPNKYQDTAHSKLSVCPITFSSNNYLITCAHYNLLYFLDKFYKTNNITYLETYKILYDLLIHIESVYNDKLSIEQFIASPFSLSINTISSSYNDNRDNSDMAYITRVAKSIKNTNDTDKPIYIDDRVNNILTNLPNEYYPLDTDPIGQQPALFDYNKFTLI